MKLNDIQNQKDTRNTPINKVGVKGLKYPVVLQDRTNGTQNSIADINMYVELPHEFRGTHMSRFVEILHHYHKETIIDNLEKLLLEMKKKLDADVAYLEMEFPYFIQKEAPITKEKSLMSYNCGFKANLKKKFELEMFAKVPVVSLCPCSKEISEYSAHNQRAYITLSVSYKQFIWLEELILFAENASSSEIFSLLKRPDEKFITEKSYDNPKFVEDIARDIAQILQNDVRITSYKIEAESIESIHNHNAYAMIKSE
ncbi:MAG TPA: GTP cyclohydrolase I FolE2 [Candidatus Cloacimonetes bacterium]|nr:GTP cyclohydrolase I FolE2 [Candidatus Cloacimonadota bacterium]HEX37559.1 GTP cyclohydrolase I FolE2 [Candidatus Cloacimonadota bacterium]